MELDEKSRSFCRESSVLGKLYRRRMNGVSVGRHLCVTVCLFMRMTAIVDSSSFLQIIAGIFSNRWSINIFENYFI